MHRWFFANEREECVPKIESEDPNAGIDSDLDKDVNKELPIYADWPFCVIVRRPMEGNEYAAITGNCDELGNWDAKGFILMDRNPTYKEDDYRAFKFTATIRIPRNFDIKYRYCIVAIDPILDVSIIRFWEVHAVPRIIRTCHNMLKNCDIFGVQNVEGAEYQVDRGWTTGETFVQFKIFNAPFIWLKQTPRLLYVYMQPMYESEPVRCDLTCSEAIRLTTVSIYNRRSVADTLQNTLLAFTEVANLQHAVKLHLQAPSGARCGVDDLQLFHCTIYSPESTLYRLDLYTFAKKAAHDEPPYHYGYGFIYPNQLINSEGCLRVKITCASTHRPLIEMNIKYLIIRPLQTIKCNLQLSYSRFWRHGHQIMDIGHRGTGPTYQLDNDVYRENTVSAFRRAQRNHADMIEFDVMLTKDAQVVIFHDFVLKFAQQSASSLQQLIETTDVFVFPNEQLNRLKLLAMGGVKRGEHLIIPIQALTYDELRLANALRFASNEGCDLDCDQFLEDQQPFQLLSDLFDVETSRLPESLGFNIEVKWPQQDMCRRWEHESFKPSFDRNFYVDTILELVFKLAGKRRIFFSSFDADICVLLRYKQNYYPVLLQIMDIDNPIQFLDQRVRVLDNALYFSYSMEFFGLCAHNSIIIKKPLILGQVRELHMQVIIWGAANNHVSARERFKRYGIIGIIFDRIDQHDQKGDELQDIVCCFDTMATRGTICAIQYMERINKCRRRF